MLKGDGLLRKRVQEALLGQEATSALRSSGGHKVTLIASMAKINKGSRTVFGCDLYVNYERASHHFAHLHVMRGDTKVAVFDFSGRLMSKDNHTSEELVHTLGQWIGGHHREIIAVWRDLLDKIEPRRDGKKR
jgi:hypothetical protein